MYLKILRPDRCHVRNTKNKTYRIEDIGFTTPIEASDRIETLVPKLRCKYKKKSIFIAIVYHPEITVRTAYDLKPF